MSPASRSRANSSVEIVHGRKTDEPGGKGVRGFASKLAVRVVADAFQRSSSQVLKLLEEHRSSQHLGEVLRLADLAGYHIALRLKKTPAA